MSLLADFLETKADHLVGRWKARLIELAGGKDRPGLGEQDHIPLFLKEAVDALRGGKPEGQNPQDGFDVEALLHEYDVFRSIVFHAASEEKVEVTIQEMQVFADVVARAVARGVSASRAVEKQRLLEHVREFEARWSLVADTLPVLISFVTKDERYGLVNKAYEDWFGLSREELIGRSILEVIGEPAYQVLGPYVRRGLAGESFSFEQEQVPYRHGGPRDVKVTFVARKDRDGQNDGYVALLEDITERRRLERELASKAEFERQLIGIVSHDLRNPLNVVSMASQLLVRSGTDERTAKLVARIQNAAQSATCLVRDLLDFSEARIGGGLTIECRTCDAHALLRSTVDELELTFPSRRIDTLLEGNGEGHWDPARLTQLLQNLLTNAIHYSPATDVVKVSTGAEAGQLVLRVHNGGTPIPADKLTDIFDSFERAGAGPDRASRGVGLGLYIVKQVVIAHQGTVEATSSASEGTTFTVRLPFGKPG